jgi:hypothetical protein
MSQRIQLFVAFTAILLTFLANGQAPVSDYDRRAAAAIYSCYDGRDVKLESINDEKVRKGLTRFEVDPATKKGTYSLDFGGVTGGVDSRGYIRITRGGDLSDVTRSGFKVLGIDKETGGEVVSKAVTSAADQFMQVGVRRQIGNVILAVSQRRPINEDATAAGAAVTQKFKSLLEFARQFKVLDSGGEVKLTLMSIGAQPELKNGEPLPISVSDTSEKEMRIRIEVTGKDGKAIELKKLTVQLTGTLVPHCKLKFRDQMVDPSKKLDVEKPAPENDIVIVLPPASPGPFLEKLFALSEGTPMLALKVNARPK